MESMLVKWKGKVFKYVLFVLDVFSRYYWFFLLEGKKSSSIAAAFLNVYKEYGFFRVI